MPSRNPWEALADALVREWKAHGAIEIREPKGFAEDLADWLAGHHEREGVEFRLNAWLLEHPRVEEVFVDEVELLETLRRAAQDLEAPPVMSREAIDESLRRSDLEQIDSLSSLGRPSWRPELASNPCSASFMGRPLAVDGLPPCEHCQTPLRVCVQIDLGGVPLDADVPIRRGYLHVYECPNLCRSEGEGPWTSRWTERALPSIIPPTAGRSFVTSWCSNGLEFDEAGDPDGVLEEHWVLLEAHGRRSAFDTRVGGFPSWIQGDETPICSRCRQSQTFVLQIVSTEQVEICDGGLYLFQCPQHPDVATIIFQR